NDAKDSASTQTVALTALLFLYRAVLKKDLPYVDHIERAKPSKKLPVVLTRREVESVLARLSGTDHLIACLLYGSGLRLMEAVRLRVKEIDFRRAEITIREAKGARDRFTMQRGATIEALTKPVINVRVLHRRH